MIFYSLSTLLKNKDILIIVNYGQVDQYKKLLPDGKNLGIRITYMEKKPLDYLKLLL